MEQIAGYLLGQSVHISVLFVIIAVVCFVLRNKSAHVRYLLWLLIIAKCLIPSVLTITLGILPNNKTEHVVIATEQLASTPTVNDELNQEVIVASQYLPTNNLSYQKWFAIFWIVGAMGMISVTIIKALRTNSILRKNRDVLPGSLRVEVDEMMAELTKKPACYCIEGIGQPFVWGLFKGSIYLPEEFQSNTDHKHRRQVIMHELAHISRGDPIVNVLQVIGQVVFFFHPLVWIANRIIRAEREKCCDETAIAKLGTSPRDYGKAIVDTLVNEYKSTLPVPSMAIAGPVKNIENRIKTIMRPNKKFYKRPAAIVLASVLLLAVIAVPTTVALTEQEIKTEVIRNNGPVAESDKFVVDNVRFEPIKQGKNIVWVTVTNKSNLYEFFRVHMYSRSVDYGPSGVGWGASKYERLEAGETKTLRCMYKIQGPVTENTYTKLSFYEPTSLDNDEDTNRNHFAQIQYSIGDLEVEKSENSPSKASDDEFAKASHRFAEFQDDIRNKDYQSAWGMLSDDYKLTDYHGRSIEIFKKQMEPTHTLHSAFLWEKDDLLRLKPVQCFESNGKLLLSAVSGKVLWQIDFINESGQLKIDWISDYKPKILDIQEENEKNKKKIQKFVKAYFKSNRDKYRGVKFIDWGFSIIDENENMAIKCQYEARVDGQRKPESFNEIFEFDKNGNFITKKPAVIEQSLIDNQKETTKKDSARGEDEKELSVESKFLSVTKGFLEEIGIDLEILNKPGQAVNNTNNCLDELQAEFITKAALTNEDVKVLTAPKVQILDNEQAIVSIKTDLNYISRYKKSSNGNGEPEAITESIETGTNMSVKPKITNENDIYLETKITLSEACLGKELLYKDKYPFYKPSKSTTEIVTTATIPNNHYLLTGATVNTFDDYGEAQEQIILILVKASIL